jgi:hypothetical protein
MQDSDTNRVPTGASDLQKCVVPFAILMVKPAFRADLRISGDGPPFTTIVVSVCELPAVGFESLAAAGGLGVDD